MSSRDPVSPPNREVAECLLARARDARQHAYAPYSRFPVGAALLTGAGDVVLGCNVENAAFGLTNCAERTAVFKAISDGVLDLRAIAIVGPEDERPCSPCGSCRQVLFEFNPALWVISPGGADMPPKVAQIAELLPGAFGPERLRAGEGLR